MRTYQYIEWAVVGWCQSTCFARGSWWGQIKVRQATQKIKELIFIFFYPKWLRLKVTCSIWGGRKYSRKGQRRRVENATRVLSFTCSIVHLTPVCTCMYAICKYKRRHLHNVLDDLKNAFVYLQMSNFCSSFLLLWVMDVLTVTTY